MQYSRDDQMFTGFPIEQIEKHIKYLIDFSVPLPFTDGNITYKCDKDGTWLITSPNWIGLEGMKYSLELKKNREWSVLINGRFACKLIGFDTYLSNLADKSNGSTTSWMGLCFISIGIIMMLIGLFYDTSVESDSKYSYSRIINSGKVSDRETITNIGGFLSICGSIFICRASNKQSDDNEVRQTK
jgi:hypothetical protein